MAVALFLQWQLIVNYNEMSATKVSYEGGKEKQRKRVLDRLDSYSSDVHNSQNISRLQSK